MTYTPETQRILDAIKAGNVCPECFVPNGDRHLDLCPNWSDENV